MSRSLNVLILCTGNSARSILAEAILNRYGEGKIVAHSAGSRPQGAPHQLALKLLHSLGYDTRFARSKSWSEFATENSPTMDFVLTVCDSAASEECPFWPGAPATGHWGLPDPAAVTGSLEDRRQAFRSAYDILKRRIDAFIVTISDPVAEREALKDRLAEIGKIGSENSSA